MLTRLTLTKERNKKDMSKDVTTPRRILAEQVIARRKLLGISQDMLAKRMKGTRPTVKQIETANPMVSADDLLRVCEVLFIDPMILLDQPMYDDGITV